MARDPFDKVCACEHETETHYCVCTSRQHPDYIGPSGPCTRCKSDNHRMVTKLTSVSQKPDDTPEAGKA